MKVLDWSKMPKGVRVECVDSERMKGRIGQLYINVVDKRVGILFATGRAIEWHKAPKCELREQEQFTYWPGGECPLPDGVMVEVVYRNRDRATVSASSFRWSYVDEWDSGYGAYDIIAYRILGLADGWKYPHEVENDNKKI